MGKTVLALACAGLLAGVPVGGKMLASTPPTFDTVLTFNQSAQAGAGFLSATVAAPNHVQSFAFNTIHVPIGLPADMNIYVGGVLVMVVAFPDDYLGQPFAYGQAGTSHRLGTFVNGNVNFN